MVANLELAVLKIAFLELAVLKGSHFRGLAVLEASRFRDSFFTGEPLKLSALCLSPVDYFENYIFEISRQN